MKSIVFLRHGESFDDIYNEFGSWSDRELTPLGVTLALSLSKLLKKKYKFEVIYTSPLKRALQTGKIIAQDLKLELIEDPFLIERNTYGLLTGLNRDIAIEKYPELNSSYLQGKFIVGSERYPDFLLRVKTLLARLEMTPYDNILCITHGYVMTAIIEEYCGKNRDISRNSMNNGSYFSAHLSGGKVTLLESSGITFTEDKDVIKGLNIRKFKTEYENINWD